MGALVLLRQDIESLFDAGSRRWNVKKALEKRAGMCLIPLSPNVSAPATPGLSDEGIVG